MNETWESLFVLKAKEAGHSDTFIEECLDYAHKLRLVNMPVIFNIEHLAYSLGIDEKLFFALLTNKENNYIEYNIKKKTGGFRKICAPKRTLKYIQRWICANILDNEKNISEYAHAFIRKQDNNTKNAFSNASTHLNKPVIITIDLKDFFHQIDETKVKQYFVGVGYENELAGVLASLCCKKFRCPQGAPTSPILSNVIFKPVDDDIVEFCKKYHLLYSRYADDITVSSEDENLCTTNIIHQLKRILRAHGFRINNGKTKVLRKGHRQIITGFSVSNGIHIPKSYRHEIWRELHFCMKFGPENHNKHLNQINKTNRGYYKSWLLGKIQYVRQYDVKQGDKMLTAFNKINWIM